MQWLEKMKAVFDYLGGANKDLSIQSLAWMRGPLWWGVWWGLLVLVIVLFSGQSSKFIYIDF